MDDKTRPVPGQAAHDEAANVPATGAPARQAGASEAELGRNHESGLNTGARGGIGSAARQQPQVEPPYDVPTVGETLNGGPSQQPREDTRLSQPSSQGLAGAQGSGGGAERGPNEVV